MTKIKVVSFDVGGTLIHTNPTEDKVFLNVIRKFGLSADPSLVNQKVTEMYAGPYQDECKRNPDFWADSNASVQIWNTIYTWLSKQFGFHDVAEQIALEMYEVYNNYLGWELFEDTVDVLNRLQNENYIIVATSNWDTNLETILEGLGIRRYFDLVISSAAVGYRKPQKEIFQIITDTFSVAPQAVLHIGDMVDADGDGPFACGMNSLIINRDGRELTCSYPVISDLNDLFLYV